MELQIQFYDSYPLRTSWRVECRRYSEYDQVDHIRLAIYNEYSTAPMNNPFRPAWIILSLFLATIPTPNSQQNVHMPALISRLKASSALTLWAILCIVRKRKHSSTQAHTNTHTHINIKTQPFGLLMANALAIESLVAKLSFLSAGASSMIDQRSRCFLHRSARCFLP